MLYEGLVKALRNCSDCYCGDCKHRDLLEPGNCVKCTNKLIDEAADAIENLDEICQLKAEDLRNTPQWISVDDQLPKINQRVIAMRSGRTWEAGMFQGLSYLNEKGDPHIWQWKGNIFKHIDYWMPKKGALPEPPKEGE